MVRKRNLKEKVSVILIAVLLIQVFAGFGFMGEEATAEEPVAVIGQMGTSGAVYYDFDSADQILYASGNTAATVSSGSDAIVSEDGLTFNNKRFYVEQGWGTQGVKFVLKVETAGEYIISLGNTYSLKGNNLKYSVNGGPEITFEGNVSTAPNGEVRWDELGKVNLIAGDNTILLTRTNYNTDLRLDVIKLVKETDNEPALQPYTAANGQLYYNGSDDGSVLRIVNGTTSVAANVWPGIKTYPGVEGTPGNWYHVADNDSETSPTTDDIKYQFTIEVPKAGDYQIAFGQLHQRQGAWHNVSVNGSPSVETTSSLQHWPADSDTSSWPEDYWVQAGTFFLQEGKNIITLTKTPNVRIFLDTIRLTEANSESASPSPKPSPAASPSPLPDGTYYFNYGNMELYIPEDSEGPFQKGSSTTGGIGHYWWDCDDAVGRIELNDIAAGIYEIYYQVPLVHTSNADKAILSITDSLGKSVSNEYNFYCAQNQTDITQNVSPTGIKSGDWIQLEGKFTFFKMFSGLFTIRKGEKNGNIGNVRFSQIKLVKIEDVPIIPMTKNVKIEGKNKPGATLKASYQYIEENDVAEKDSEYKWYTKETENASWKEAASGTTTAAEGSTYTLKDNERYAKFEIIPKSDCSDPAVATGQPASAEFAVTQDDLVPQALDITVEGKPYLQAQLTGTYTYQDVNGDAEGESQYKWVMSSDPYADESTWTILEEGTCNSETPIVYTIPVSIPVGTYIRLGITPVNTESTLNTGSTVYSNPVGPTENVDLKPEISDVGFDGQVVNAEGLIGLAIGGEAEVSYTYTNLLGVPEDPAATEIQWYRGDTQVGPWTAIEGAVGRTYTPLDADSGKYIRYGVIPAAADGITGEETFSPARMVKWNLKFADEFDYDVSSADEAPFSNKWISDTGPRTLGSPEITSARIPENTTTQNGKMIITQRKEHNDKYNYPHTWTTGCVWTREKVGPYGYYETSMKLAKATGLNQSFWTAGKNGSVEEESTGFIELDFCEGHYPDQMKSNLHRYEGNKRMQSSVGCFPYGTDGKITLGDGFTIVGGYLKPNVADTEWTDSVNEDSYRMYANDKLMRSTISVQYVPAAQQIYCSVAIYPGWAGALVDSDAHNSTLEFEYVRYYEEIGVSQEGTIGTEIGTIELTSAIAEAEDILTTAVIGNETGNYSAQAKQELETALAAAKAVTNAADKAKAAAALNNAIEAFKNSEIGDRGELEKAIEAAEELLESTSVGTGFGQCPQSYYNNLERAIERSETLLKNAPTQAQLDSQLNLLQRAMDTAKAQIKLSGTVTNNGQVIDIAAVIQADGTVSVDAPVTNVKLKVPSVMPEGFELPIRYNGTNVVLNLPEGRTMTAGNYEVKWSRNNNSSTLYTIDFSNLTAVNGLISVTINKASGDKVLSNGAEITTKLSENSYEAAEALYTGGDFTAIYEGSTSVTIYTNKLGKYEIRSESTVTPTPTPTPGGGNGNGSGNWTPGVIVPPNSNTNKVKFTDIAGHWAENEIRELAKEGIINGRSETEFVPEDTMTRAEYAALIRRAIGLNPSIYSGGFNDVEGNAWYANEIQAIVNAGIMSGDADGSFRPNAPISREEMAKVIVNAYLAKSGAADVTAAEISFTDSGEIAPWAQEYIGKAATLGLINGMGDGSYAPKGNMTRAQGSVVIYRLIK